MSDSARVLSLQYLVELRIALSQFREETQQSLTSIAFEIRRTREWLKQKHNYWRRQVEYCKKEISHARQTLNRCLHENNRDCRGIERKISEAYHALREANEKLEKVRYWSNIIEQAITDYQKQAYRLEQQIHQDIPKAGIFLGRKIEQLEEYLALNPVCSGVIPTTNTPLKTSSDAQVDKSTEMSPLEGQSKNTPPVIWEEKGIQNVPVKHLLPHLNGEKCHVKSKEDFTRVSYEDMVEGFRKLQSVVLPGVQEGATEDEFSEMDAQRGLDYEHGYRRIYDAFYGQDAIHVNKLGEDCYSIDNGYHRLFVAREIGLENIPAKVAERVPPINQ